ncbi:hypothetical protein [Chitinophaga sp. LS1]|uniref:hypothetical protein n=1 Tax=Chitinophaga sp. LS1 TaxID=3051176 RepID=UPI002AAAC345|nr:hypothetical protein [Chitinophaga sp. LS1]WPV67547.1 hypothetical protein QQL36_02260 [Chitinophaga sp. LS1]
MSEQQFNLMKVIYNGLFLDFPLKYREAACKEFSWSIPTFYRKMRKSRRSLELVGGFSIAEWQILEQIGHNVITNLTQAYQTEMTKYKRLLDNNNRNI